MGDDGWWLGECNGTKGYFSGSYVELQPGLCASICLYLFTKQHRLKSLIENRSPLSNLARSRPKRSPFLNPVLRLLLRVALLNPVPTPNKRGTVDGTSDKPEKKNNKILKHIPSVSLYVLHFSPFLPSAR